MDTEEAAVDTGRAAEDSVGPTSRRRSLLTFAEVSQCGPCHCRQRGSAEGMIGTAYDADHQMLKQWHA